MEFKVHLFVQKHYNRTYTVMPLPFYDLSAYGNNLEEIKKEISEALRERLQELPPTQLQQFEFNPKASLHKVGVEVRPLDRKKRNKRRELLRINFSLYVMPQEDDQLLVRVPRLGQYGPAFIVYQMSELASQAQVELGNWLDGMSLEQVMEFQHARSEVLEVLTLDVQLKRIKERNQPSESTFDPFGNNRGDDFWALKEVGLSLTAQYAEGRFRRTFRRDDIVLDLMQTLAGNRNNSLLLVGPSEAGKTAIVHEIIRRIQRDDCPPALKDREVWMLSPDRIIAGAQYIGTWEERIQNIVEECRKRQHILYVEDLPGLLETGRWSKSDSNVGLALRPHIASGDITLMGEGLPERVTMGDNIGPGFMNLFRRVEVQPMQEEEALAVLNNVARELEREHNVRVLPEANQVVVQLARRFLPYRAFPGKAVRLLEETTLDAAREGGRSPGRGSGLLHRIGRNATINHNTVLSTFARMSGMPEFIINDASRLDMDEVEKYFIERILGQPDALQTVVNLIATVKAGLNDPQKPMGTLMFIGPTGVGKTQMAKTLATYIFGSPERLIRFDMSEYRDMDGSARLIGAFGRDGELTRRVREQPFSVVLLDEFEKADPRIFDIFLQVLGEGRLTDSTGRTTYFNNCIIIMTSNLGAGAKNFQGLGFSKSDNIDPLSADAERLYDHYRQEVVDYFRPEFVNRIDHLVVFRPLDPAALRNIATRELSEILLRDGITRRNILVEIEDTVIDMVLEEGYSPQYGARPLKRAIERLVVSPMARELAGRSTQDTNLLRVGVDRERGGLVLKNVPISEAGASTRVELRTGLADATARQLRMDTAQLVEGFAMLRRKLADWLDSEVYINMSAEKSRLLEETQSIGFWDLPDDARVRLNRFYFLERLVKRVQQLYDRAEYLEDLAVIINKERDARYQHDLARDYENLHRDASYLDIEMRTANLPHRNKVVMLMRLLGGTPVNRAQPPSDTWLRRLSHMYLRWAERKGYDHVPFLLLNDPHDPAPRKAAFKRLNAGNFDGLLRRLDEAPYTEEIALVLEGTNVFGFLKGERGLHRLEKDNNSDELVQIGVFAIPDGTDINEWLKDYRDIKLEIDEGMRPSPPAERLTVIRSYSPDKGAGERLIRDMRTNMRSVQVKDVLEKGGLDDFILAYLEQESDTNTWEDRFPPTFPF